MSRLPLLLPGAGWVLGLSALRGDFVSLDSVIWLMPTLIFLSLFRPLRRICLAGLAGLIWGGMSLITDARVVAVDASWTDQTVTIEADINSVRRQPGRVRLTLDEVRRQDGAILAGRVFLYGYGGRNRINGWAALQSGDRIAASVRLHLPENSANPGAFNYQAYCFDHHIALIGSVSGDIRVLSSHPTWLETLRQKTREILAPMDPGRAGILQALLLANRSRIPNRIQEAFSASGAAHLLAISGLHVGMVAIWAFAFCWWLLTRREAWIIRIPIRKQCLAIGLLAACGYAFLAGWPLPTRRAVLLLGGTALAWWLRSKMEPVNTLLAALMLILLFDPQAVISISLWLSFTAAFALLTWAGKLPHERQFRLGKWLLGLLWVSILAFLATLPLIAFRFEIIPTYSLLANFLMVPLYTLIILPLALMAEIFTGLGLDSVAIWLFQMAGVFIDLGNRFLLILYEWPAGRLWIPSPSWFSGILYALGMGAAGLLLLRRRKIGALAGAVIVLATYLLIVIPERPPSHTRFVAWDVGQGASSSLRFSSGQVFVVDAPGRPSARFNGGTKVASGLRNLGAAHIDVLALSHAQQDHIGGINRLADKVRYIRELWLADVPDNHRHKGVRRLLRKLKRGGTRIRWLKQGDRIKGDGYAVQVLWPPQGFDPSNANNASLVLSIRLDNDVSILLPGDIEAEAEKRIVASDLRRHDLMLIPHHGSTTSSSPVWVKASGPVHAISQSGRHNRYGFPKAAVVQRYRRQGSKIWNTADGAVIAHASGARPATWELRNWQPGISRNRDDLLRLWRRHF